MVNKPAKSASNYAVLAKNKVVSRYKEEIPEEVRKVVTDGLVRDCYVDDGIAMPNGGEDVEMIKEHIGNTLGKGGFEVKEYFSL